MKKETMSLISIKKVLLNPENNPNTWYCLPSDSSKWTLETEGMFSLDSVDFEPGSDEYLPEQVKNGNWVEVLEGADVEDIINNVNFYIENPTMEMLLEALVFYYENDAFKYV